MATHEKADEVIHVQPNEQPETSPKSGMKRRKHSQKAKDSVGAENNNQRKLPWIITLTLIVLLVIISFVPGVLRLVQPSCPSCDPTCCLPNWIGYQQKCYYFSEKEENWNSSQDFCTLHHASLAIIKTEMNFVMRYKGRNSFWIGLRRDPGQSWKWTNGDNSSLEVIGDGGDCTYLTEDAKASSSRCSTMHHFICSKSANSQRE